MRALGYLRADGPQAEAFRAFEKAFADYCRFGHHDPSEIYRDGSEQRTEYQRLLSTLRASGGRALVVVPDATHLGGDLESVVRALVDLDATGAKTACADRQHPDPVQNALRTLGVRGVSRERSEKVRESMRARALRGLGLGRPLYGYRIGEDGSMEAVKAEAGVVELVYRLYTQDKMGFRLIAQDLNERGIKTRRGGNWNVVSIRDMLRNPGYMGTYSRFGMLVPKGYPPIVSIRVFRAAQDIMGSRRPVGRIANPEPFLLSGMAYCGECGNKMMGVTRRQVWKRKDGRRSSGVYRYYQCQSRQNQSRCDYHTWRAPRLEAAVVSQLKLALEVKGEKVPPESAQAPTVPSPAKAAKQRRIHNAERRFVEAVKRAAAGEVALPVVGEYLGALDAARTAAVSGEMASPSKALAGWDALPLDQRRDFLTEYVARVTVKDEAVEVAVR